MQACCGQPAVFCCIPTWQIAKTWPNPRVWCHFNGPWAMFDCGNSRHSFSQPLYWIIYHIWQFIWSDSCWMVFTSAKMWPTSIPLWVCRIFWDSCQTWWAPGYFLFWVFLVFIGKIEQTMQTFSFYSNFNLYLTETVMLGELHDASDMFCLQQSN